MKMIKSFAANFLNSGRGYVEIRDVKKASLPVKMNRIYNLEPHQMSVREVEQVFGEVLRGLSY
jgi:hypothetical protein|tara:strand:- start:1379 stop:1567 length:189 start_codon:yes stop_codon:yes gene_type:complete